MMTDEDYYSLSTENEILRDRLEKAEADLFNARFRNNALDAAFKTAAERVWEMLTDPDSVAIELPQELHSVCEVERGVEYASLATVIDVANASREDAVPLRTAAIAEIGRYLNGRVHLDLSACTACGQRPVDCLAERTICGYHHDTGYECDECRDEYLSAEGDRQYQARKEGEA